MDIKVIFTIGISASGKSTWANELFDKAPHETTILCRDNIRHTLAYMRLQSKGYKPAGTPSNLWKVWNWKWEKEVTDIWWEQFDHACVNLKNKTIICADTNLNRDRLNGMKQKMKSEYGITDFEEIRFDISIEEAWKRDAARPDGVGHDVIMKQWLQYQDMINFEEKYTPNPGTRKAIMADIDGTLAIMKDRGPFEWLKVGNDDLNPVVYHIVRGYYQQGYEIIIMSGRDSAAREETEKWLVKHNVPYTELHMRAMNDMRKDSIVKSELFWSNVATKFDVEVVIDDRPQVCREWIKIGLKTLIVGNPWIEF